PAPSPRPARAPRRGVVFGRGSRNPQVGTALATKTRWSSEGPWSQEEPMAQGLRPTRPTIALLGLAAAFLAAIGLAAAVTPTPPHADGYALPIGGSQPPSAIQPDDPPEDDPPKFYDEEIPATSESVIFVVDRSASMSLPTKPFTGADGQPVTDGSRLD